MKRPPLVKSMMTPFPYSIDIDAPIDMAAISGVSFRAAVLMNVSLERTNAYHFQQGRTDADGNIIVGDDLDSRLPWLVSRGMYGKW